MATDATYPREVDDATGSGSRVSVLLFAGTGAIASAVFFGLCWLGAYLPFGSPTHMYLQLFTTAETSSALALGQGLCWSLIFGAVAGGLIALVHNALAYLTRR